MEAVILAAGCGNRLGTEAGNRPKALLEFDGTSLLQRHVRLLVDNGIKNIHLVVGFQSGLIIDHLEDSAANIHYIRNPRYTDGSLTSLGCARDILLNHDPFLLMDADVLYDPRILQRLIATDIENCMLIDRDFVPGDEPVKVCIDAADRIIEFGKRPTPDPACVKQGESVGFFKFSQAIGKALAARIDARLEQRRNDVAYEEAIRDCLLAAPGQFGYEDITGLQWIEIDFPGDIIRAREQILPTISE